MDGITRRSASKLIALVAVAPRRWALPPLRAATAPPPTDCCGNEFSQAFGRTRRTDYTADATILFLGIPIYNCRGAGAGAAEARDWKTGDGRALALNFAAGSNPEKTRGLNRLGFFQEVIVERQGRPEQISYFGFMTASPEESESEGRRALEDDSKAEVAYQAVTATLDGNREQCARKDLQLSSEYTWRRMDELIALVRSELHPRSQDYRARRGPFATFLYAVMSFAWSGKQSADVNYCYNGKSYGLSGRRQPDPRRGEAFARLGLTQEPASIERIQGHIASGQQGKKTSFRLWIEAGGGLPLPLRFEYKPRSFLRIAFEADPAQDSRQLFSEGGAMAMPSSAPSASGKVELKPFPQHLLPQHHS